MENNTIWTKLGSVIYIIILCFLIGYLFSCTRKPEFYDKSGRGFYTNHRCIHDTSYTEFSYHYGYNFFRGKYEYHLGPHNVNKCLEYQIDTIEIKTDE